MWWEERWGRGRGRKARRETEGRHTHKLSSLSVDGIPQDWGEDVKRERERGGGGGCRG